MVTAILWLDKFELHSLAAYLLNQNNLRKLFDELGSYRIIISLMNTNSK